MLKFESVEEIPDKVCEAIPTYLEDEINLTEISRNVQIEAEVNDLFKVEGEYKNPKYKPWTTIDPGKEFKTLWESIKSDNETKGVEEIGGGSATFEQCFEFWGTWRVKKPGITIKHLEDSENWPDGVKITEVKPA